MMKIPQQKNTEIELRSSPINMADGGSIQATSGPVKDAAIVIKLPKKRDQV